jgi:hypothetical protein
MRRFRPRAAIIELHWRQRTPEEWQAVLVDRHTGKRYEVSSGTELWAVIQQVLHVQLTSTAAGSDTRLEKQERATELWLNHGQDPA